MLRFRSAENNIKKQTRNKKIALVAAFFIASASLSITDKGFTKNITKLNTLPAIVVKSPYRDFYEDCLAYGFDVDSDTWIPASISAAGTISSSGSYYRKFYKYTCQYYDNDILNYQSDFAYAVLRTKTSSRIHAIIYRGILSPSQPGRNYGFLGIGSYGDDWYARCLDTTIYLASGHQMESWAPQNSPSSSTSSIGVGVDSSGFSISASVDFTSSELTVASNSNYATNKYRAVYSISGYGDYAANSHIFYGMAITRCEEDDSPFSCTVTQKTTYNGSQYHGDCSDSFTFALSES